MTKFYIMTIDDRTKEILSNIEILDGNKTRITETLTPKEYKKVNEVLETYGVSTKASNSKNKIQITLALRKVIPDMTSSNAKLPRLPKLKPIQQ